MLHCPPPCYPITAVPPTAPPPLRRRLPLQLRCAAAARPRAVTAVTAPQAVTHPAPPVRPPQRPSPPPLLRPPHRRHSALHLRREGGCQGQGGRDWAGAGVTGVGAGPRHGGSQLQHHPTPQLCAATGGRARANSACGMWDEGAMLRRRWRGAGRRWAVAAVLTWKIPGNVWRPPRRLRVAGPRVPLEFGPS